MQPAENQSIRNKLLYLLIIHNNTTQLQLLPPLTLPAKLLPLNGWNLKPTLAGGALMCPHLRNKNHRWAGGILWLRRVINQSSGPFHSPSLMRDLCFPGGQGDGLSLGPVGNLTRSHGPSSNNHLTSGETTAEQRGSGSATPTETYRKRRQEFYVFSA